MPLYKCILRMSAIAKMQGHRAFCSFVRAGTLELVPDGDSTEQPVVRARKMPHRTAQVRAALCDFRACLARPGAPACLAASMASRSCRRIFVAVGHPGCLQPCSYCFCVIRNRRRERGRLGDGSWPRKIFPPARTVVLCPTMAAPPAAAPTGNRILGFNGPRTRSASGRERRAPRALPCRQARGGR